MSKNTEILEGVCANLGEAHILETLNKDPWREDISPFLSIHG